MRIVTQTDKKLIFKHLSLHHILGRSMLIGGLITFGLFLLLTTTSANLNCQRTSQNKIDCLLERFTAVRKLENLSVLDLSDAEVKEYPKGYPRYETIVISEKGTISLLGHTGGDYKSNYATVVNIKRFIVSTNQKAFSIQVNGSNFFLIERVGLALIIGIGFLFIIRPVVICTFDKNVNQLILIQKSFFLQKRVEHSLDLIVDVQVENSTKREDTLGLVDKLYRITIILEDSKPVPLFQDYSLLKTDAHFFAQKIYRYIGS